jgi:hypothetical protein
MLVFGFKNFNEGLSSVYLKKKHENAVFEAHVRILIPKFQKAKLSASQKL